jgi:uncharacterized CHY-type Zn-finger protein
MKTLRSPGILYVHPLTERAVGRGTSAWPQSRPGGRAYRACLACQELGDCPIWRPRRQRARAEGFACNVCKSDWTVRWFDTDDGSKICKTCRDKGDKERQAASKPTLEQTGEQAIADIALGKLQPTTRAYADRYCILGCQTAPTS